MNTLNPNTDGKPFWDKCKQYFSIKDNRWSNKDAASHVSSAEKETIVKNN